MRTTMLATMAVILTLCSVAAAEAPVKIHRREKSYVQMKNAEVLAAFLAFVTVRTEEQDQNRLGTARERDALLLEGGTPSVRRSAMGAMMMGAAVVFAAHAPERV